MRVLGGQGQCKLVVVQFTDWQRSHHSEHKITDLKQIEKIAKYHADYLDKRVSLCNAANFILKKKINVEKKGDPPLFAHQRMLFQNFCLLITLLLLQLKLVKITKVKKQ